MKRRGKTTVLVFATCVAVFIAANLIFLRRYWLEQFYVYQLSSNAAKTRYVAAKFLLDADVHRAVPRFLDIALRQHNELEAGGMAHDHVVVSYFEVSIRRFGERALDYLIPELAGDGCRTALCARLIGSLGPESVRAVPQLIELLASRDRRVRGAAIITLGDIGIAGVRAFPYLREIVDHRGEMSQLAKTALRQMQYPLSFAPRPDKRETTPARPASELPKSSGIPPSETIYGTPFGEVVEEN